MKTQTESISPEVAKLIEDTVFWFEQRIEALNDIAESEELIVIAKSNSEDLELTAEQSRAFKAGISTAINIIGKFPLSLDRSVNSFDLDDFEA